MSEQRSRKKILKVKVLLILLLHEFGRVSLKVLQTQNHGKVFIKCTCFQRHFLKCYYIHDDVYIKNLMSVSFFSFLFSVFAKCFIKSVLCGTTATKFSSLHTRRENLKNNIMSGWAERGNRTRATGVLFLATACWLLSHMETCHHLEREKLSGPLASNWIHRSQFTLPDGV